MKSKIVSNPNRKQAERLFLAGTPILKIAKDLNLPYQPLYRHLTDLNKSGISRQLKKAFDLRDSAEASDILNEFTERIEGLISKLEVATNDTEASQDYVVMIASIKELRSCYESLLKFEITKEQNPAINQSDELYWRQKFREEDQELLGEMFDMLSPDEMELYKQLNMKMTSRNPDMKIQLKEKFQFEDIEDIQDTEESNTDIPVAKDKRFKRTTKPLQQEIKAEQEPQETIPVPAAIEIPGGRGSRLSRHLIGRKVYDRQDEQHGIGGSQGGGASLPYSNDPDPIQETTDREYRPDNAPAQDDPFKRDYKD